MYEEIIPVPEGVVRIMWIPEAETLLSRVWTLRDRSVTIEEFRYNRVEETPRGKYRI